MPESLSVLWQRLVEKACLVSIVDLEVLKSFLLLQFSQLVDKRFYSVGVSRQQLACDVFVNNAVAPLKMAKPASLHLKSVWPRCPASR